MRFCVLLCAVLLLLNLVDVIGYNSARQQCRKSFASRNHTRHGTLAVSNSISGTSAVCKWRRARRTTQSHDDFPAVLLERAFRESTTLWVVIDSSSSIQLSEIGNRNLWLTLADTRLLYQLHLLSLVTNIFFPGRHDSYFSSQIFIFTTPTSGMSSSRKCRYRSSISSSSKTGTESSRKCTSCTRCIAKA